MTPSPWETRYSKPGFIDYAIVGGVIAFFSLYAYGLFIKAPRPEPVPYVYTEDVSDSLNTR